MTRTAIRAGSMLMLLACGSAAHAQIAAMPAGSWQWIELSANSVAAGLCCDDVGFVGQMPVPSPNYVGDPVDLAGGSFIFANALSTPNRMESASLSNRIDGGFLRNSMVDTYVISGPPGTDGTPVTATVSFSADGALFVRSRGPNNTVVGSAFLRVEIGTWNPSTEPNFLEQFRVSRFGPTFEAVREIRLANFGVNNEQTLPVSLTVSGPLTRTVGVPFDVAFGHDLSNSGSIVSDVRWSLPAGYTITSTRGWTDPDAPTCDPIDFNNDGVFPDDQDLADFVAVLAGSACGTCNDVDFNNDGVFPDDQDLVVFLDILGGGNCG